MELKFRPLRADEVELRVSTCNANGFSLLLYKDARCDQNILDETVGAMNWQRHHSRENANCTVSIWDTDKEQWIEKEDTGTESRKLRIADLATVDGVIAKLVIKDNTGKAVFSYGVSTVPQEPAKMSESWEDAKNRLLELADMKGVPVEEVLKMARVNALEELDVKRLEGGIAWLAEQ